MPRTPKSSSNSSQRWSMPSFFSSGFSNKRTTSTTTTRPRHAVTAHHKEGSVKAKKEKSTPATKTTEKAAATKTTRKEEAGIWMLLCDRNGRQFLWNENTGQWTYDCITVYAPPTPATNAMGYSYGYYGPHQQLQQRQRQFYSYAQPTVGYYAPSPYAPPSTPGPYASAHHQPWQSPPSVGAALPWMTPVTPGPAPVFF